MVRLRADTLAMADIMVRNGRTLWYGRTLWQGRTLWFTTNVFWRLSIFYFLLQKVQVFYCWFRQFLNVLLVNSSCRKVLTADSAEWFVWSIQFRSSSILKNWRSANISAAPNNFCTRHHRRAMNRKLPISGTNNLAQICKKQTPRRR